MHIITMNTIVSSSRFNVMLLAVGAMLWAYAPLRATVTIDLVLVGNAGNAADPRTGYGAVNYNYEIGTYEVTAAQYCEFLNAKAQSDPYELYNGGMAQIGPSWPWGCNIQRSGTSGIYTYTVPSDYANRPVNCVNFLDR